MLEREKKVFVVFSIYGFSQYNRFCFKDTFTIDDAVEKIGFGRFQIKLSLLTGIAWMADSMEMMALSILAPALECEWSLNTWQKALVTTVNFKIFSLNLLILNRI